MQCGLYGLEFLEPLNQYGRDIAEMGKWQKQKDCRASDLT
jgi:hypothetical protein